MTRMTPFFDAERIHIMGNSGSGKTTLSRQLALHLNVPCYDLDDVAYPGYSWTKSPLEARLESLQTIVKQPAWITEGAYLWWTKLLFDEADLIVWLDMPIYILSYRIAQRSLRWKSSTKRNPFPNAYQVIRHIGRTMRNQHSPIPRVPRALDDDSAVTRVATKQFLEGYPGKVVHCTSPRQVAQFKAHFLKIKVKPRGNIESV